MMYRLLGVSYGALASACQFDSVDGEFTCIDKSREAAGGARGRQGDVLGGGLLRREAGAKAGGQGHAGGQDDAGQIDRQRPVIRHLSNSLFRIGPECERGYRDSSQADVMAVINRM